MRRRFSLGTARLTRRGRGFGGAYFGETLPVTFPTTVLRARVWIALGADLSASWLSWNWLDITSRVRVDQGITLEVGRRDQFSVVSPSRAVLKLDDVDGYLSRRNPSSPYYGLLTKNTPIWIQVDPGSGYVDRYHGFVNSWPIRWSDPSGTDSTVTVECSGTLRRIGQSSPAVRSCARRTITATGPLDYWPLEDGSDSTQFVSAVSGGSALYPGNLIVFGVTTTTGTTTPAALDSLPGSLPLPEAASGALIKGIIQSYTDSGRWVWANFVYIPSASDGEVLDPLELYTGSTTYPAILTEFGLSTYWYRVKVYDSTNTLAFSSSAPAGSLDRTKVLDKWLLMVVVSTDAGGASNDTVQSLLYDATTGATVYDTGALATASTVHAALGRFTLRCESTEQIGHGHAMFFPGNTITVGTDDVNLAKAGGGFFGEQAHVRMARVCGDEGIPFQCLASESATMGPQSALATEGILRECETVDQGLLYEHQFGLAYKALSQYYNQTAKLTLDFDSAHIGGMPEPSDDDQHTRNYVTATRPSGSEATATLTSGTMGTGAGGAGAWADTISANVPYDINLPDQASWRVHLGTVDEDRWPQIPLRMHRTPTLLPSWTATILGDRITTANPPAQMTPDTIDTVLDGYSEHLDEHAWLVALNTSPYSPFVVAELDGETGRLESETSTLAAAVTTSDTSWSVATTNANELWTTDTAEVPFDADVLPGAIPDTSGGEVVTVTAVSGGSSPQTWTVTRSVNGVIKAHAAGAKLRIRRAATLAL